MGDSEEGIYLGCSLLKEATTASFLFHEIRPHKLREEPLEGSWLLGLCLKHKELAAFALWFQNILSGFPVLLWGLIQQRGLYTVLFQELNST